MRLHDLRPAPGSRRGRTRVGRGIAAGKGKTAGRGTKGQRARTGGGLPPWFEGGQTPIHMRVPKLRGFKNRFRVEYAVVNVGRIQAALESGRLEGAPRGAPATVNAELLYTAGLLGRPLLPLKILGGGELSHRVTVIADAFSAEARRKIEGAGGTALVLEPPAPTPRADRQAPERPGPERPEPEPTLEAAAGAGGEAERPQPEDAVVDAPERSGETEPSKTSAEGARPKRSRPSRAPRAGATTPASEPAAAGAGGAEAAAPTPATRTRTRARADEGAAATSGTGLPPKSRTRRSRAPAGDEPAS
jgi:large subunit ribosomal protein L15